jgi:hypothetical protein
LGKSQPATPAKEKEVLIVEHSTENLENEIHTSQRMLAEGGFAAQNDKKCTDDSSGTMPTKLHIAATCNNISIKPAGADRKLHV